MLGLALSVVRSQLNCEPVIVETRPPFEPRHYTPIYGEWRVIRVRDLPDNRQELTVARELLREEKAVPVR